jgi:hypothetical protein
MNEMETPVPEYFLFNRQWYLGRNEPYLNFKWNEIPLAKGYSVYAHINLKVSITKTDDHSGIVVLGTAFYPNALDDTNLLPLAHQIHGSKSFEDEIVKLAGSYCIIVFNEEEIVIYNDAAGFMGVYYSNNVASSTPTLLSPLVRDNRMDEDFNFKDGNDWYTGSITPYLNIKKLIPNHSLSLRSGTSKRFWPTSHEFTDSNHVEVDVTIKKIINLLQNMMIGIVTRGDVFASITGGQDSRVVLAASKSVWDKIHYFTFQGPTVKRNDVIYARMLAENLGLKHQVQQIVPTEDWLYTLYDSIGAGESIGARREIAGTCLKFAGSKVIHANGNLGAICKSYYWEGKKPTRFKTSAVLRDFTAPSQITFNGVKEWRETTPDLSVMVLYNLFYLEQRGGRWMAVGENCSSLFYESFSPFNHRQLFEYICSLPIDIQYGGNLLRILTKEMAPELLTVPFCKARRNWTKYIPERIKSKVRKLVK